MTFVRSIASTIVVVAALGSAAGSAGAQTISPTTTTTSTGVTLKTFTPFDSLFINPTDHVTTALVNTVSGTPTEYRVSRFADFRDASWIAYVARPNLAVPLTWFPAPVNGGSQLTLYFQVRAKNPLAGRPISSINGKTTVQPDFFFSTILSHRIRTTFVG
jgi:hypothetical protein